MAAVLAAGPGAVLSHRSAAHLWRIINRSAASNVLTPGTPRQIDGITIHRTRRLEPRETTMRNGIPTTSLVRTIVDLADDTTDGEFQRALHQAEIFYSLAAHELSTARTQGRRAASRLRGPRDRTRSKLERRFRSLCRDHGIPQPEINTKIEGLEVDAVWRDQRVIVEVDGWQFHKSHHAFETDRERDARLVRAGWRVIRFTHRQVVERPHEVAATVLAALASAR